LASTSSLNFYREPTSEPSYVRSNRLSEERLTYPDGYALTGALDATGY